MKILRKIRAVAIYLILLMVFWCTGVLVHSVLAAPAEKGNFIILGRSGEDSNGESVLKEEQVVLRTAPNIDSPEQGRLDSGASVRVVDITQIETEIFYLVMKVGKGGGLSGWVSEEYIYEIVSEPPAQE